MTALHRPWSNNLVFVSGIVMLRESISGLEGLVADRARNLHVKMQLSVSLDSLFRVKDLATTQALVFAIGVPSNQRLDHSIDI